MSDLEPLKPRQRRERRDFIAISTPTQTIELSEGQFFCETPKAIELWGPVEGGRLDLARLIKRFPIRAYSYIWVHTK